MYKIKNSRELSGEVSISGSKNAVLPILAASLLIKWKIRLSNVPNIWDLRTFLDIIKTLGVEYEFEGDILTLDTTHISARDLNFDMVKKIRVSILLLSPLLHHFWDIKIPFPGWCNIWKRPVDTHLNWLHSIWYDYELLKDDIIHISWNPSDGDTTINAGFWVTATENLIVANVLRHGTTTIKLRALEPHVMDLIKFLRWAWANIKIRYNHTIIVSWVDELDAYVDHSVISDYIESGTFMVLWALASREYIDIKNARIDDLYSFIEKLRDAWVRLEDLWDDTMRVYRSHDLRAVNIQTNIFPGFPTDLGSIFAVLMTQADGVSKIHEVLFEARLNFLVELDRMWWHTAILNPHEALIFWKMDLKWAAVTSWDLRAGARMVIAGLIARGETELTKVEYIERWYEDFFQKLTILWASIQNIN